MRHAFATWAIGAGVPAFVLAKQMGTSLDMIERHYGHLLPNAADATRIALDGFIATQDADAEETFGH
jgi:integrase